MAVTHPLRRSLLAIPANERRLAADAAGSDADEVVFDLEDSLAPSEKHRARETLIAAVEEHDWGETTLGYRINGTDTQWWYEDLIEPISTVGTALTTVVLPKVSDAGDVRTVATLLDSVETAVGLTDRPVDLCAQIETASGMNNAVEIAGASERLTALLFGPADYAASLGAIKGAADYPGHYWHYPLSRVAHAAASADLLALGGPYAATDDPDGFREVCAHERALGYDGKMVVDPDQVATANEVFAPTAAEAKRARRIVQHYREADPDDVVSIDGKVIDKETYRMARRILAKADTAGVI